MIRSANSTGSSGRHVIEKREGLLMEIWQIPDNIDLPIREVRTEASRRRFEDTTTNCKKHTLVRKQHNSLYALLVTLHNKRM
jgi:hypothetical protein